MNPEGKAVRIRELVETVYREGEEEGRRGRNPYVTLDRLDAVYISMTDQERSEFDAVLGEWARGPDLGKRYDAIALIDNFKITSALGDLRVLRDQLAHETDVESRDWLETVNESIARLEAEGERPDILLMGMGDRQRLSSAAVNFLGRLLKKDASFIVRTDHPDEELGAAGRALMDAGVVEVHRRKGVKLEPPLSAIYDQVFEGSVVITVEHERGEKSYLRTYHMGGEEDDLAVEHIPQPTDQHDFYLVDAANLFKRLAVFTGLAEDRPVSDLPAFVCNLGDLMAVVSGQGSPVHISDEFATALRDKVSSTRLRAVIRSDTGVAGGEVLWLDLGPSGLWVIDPSETRAAVRPVPTDTIFESLERALMP